jgi:protein disulfide-isomerase
MNSSRIALSTVALLLMISRFSAAHAAVAWTTDLPKAQSQAKAESKAVLVNFTGSDWCGWCIRLRKEVFARPEFEEYAAKRLVLVEVDFPKHKTQPETLKQANHALAAKFGIEGYPTLLVLDADGKTLGKLGYVPGGPKPFLKSLDATLPEQTASVSPANVRAHSQPPAAAPRQEPNAAKAAKGSAGPTWTPPNTDGLMLKGISGPKEKRMALVNNQTLLAGETASVKTSTGSLRVHCVEIHDGSVLVTIDGQPGQHELRLWNGL